MKRNEMRECPMCKGKGKIKAPKEHTRQKTADLRKEVSKVLVNKGYSYRETAKLLGYKSPRSVTKAVKADAK